MSSPKSNSSSSASFTPSSPERDLYLNSPPLNPDEASRPGFQDTDDSDMNARTPSRTNPHAGSPHSSPSSVTSNSRQQGPPPSFIQRAAPYYKATTIRSLQLSSPRFNEAKEMGHTLARMRIHFSSRRESRAVCVASDPLTVHSRKNTLTYRIRPIRTQGSSMMLFHRFRLFHGDQDYNVQVRRLERRPDFERLPVADQE